MTGWQCARAQKAAFSGFEPNNLSIASSTNASPIAVTTSSTHGLITGMSVRIAGHAINTTANGQWSIDVTSATTFTLRGSTGVGVGGATGTVTLDPYDTSQVVAIYSANAGVYDFFVY